LVRITQKYSELVGIISAVGGGVLGDELSAWLKGAPSSAGIPLGLHAVTTMPENIEDYRCPRRNIAP
jgi:hypothetical protein